MSDDKGRFTFMNVDDQIRALEKETQRDREFGELGERLSARAAEVKALEEVLHNQRHLVEELTLLRRDLAEIRQIVVSLREELTKLSKTDDDNAALVQRDAR